MGLLESLRNIEFEPSPMSMGLLQMGAQMLANSSNQPHPIGFGQVLGNGLMGFAQGANDINQQRLMLQKMADEKAYREAQMRNMDADNAMNAMRAKQAQYKIDHPDLPNGVQEALWASGGDLDKARKLLSRWKQNPFQALNYQLAANAGHRAERSDIRAEENQSRQFDMDQRRMEQQDRANQLQEWRLANPNYEANQKKISEAEAELSKLEQSMSEYQNVLPSYDQWSRHNPMMNGKLQSAYQAASWPLRGESMINTGVLNPGDKKALESALRDPTAYGAEGFTSLKELKAQQDQILKTARNNVAALKRTLAPATPPPFVAGQPQIQNQQPISHDSKTIGGKTYVKINGEWHEQ